MGPVLASETVMIDPDDVYSDHNRLKYDFSGLVEGHDYTAMVVGPSRRVRAVPVVFRQGVLETGLSPITPEVSAESVLYGLLDFGQDVLRYDFSGLTDGVTYVVVTARALDGLPGALISPVWDWYTLKNGILTNGMSSNLGRNPVDGSRILSIAWGEKVLRGSWVHPEGAPGVPYNPLGAL